MLAPADNTKTEDIVKKNSNPRIKEIFSCNRTEYISIDKKKHAQDKRGLPHNMVLP